MSKLKPCPFCGLEEGNIWVSGWGKDNGGHFVHCPNCGGLGPIKPTKSGAIAAWNRRPPCRTKTGK